MPRHQEDVPPRWVRNRALADYMGITEVTLWRWKRNAKLSFPPAAEINGIEYNDIDAVDAWMRARVVNRATEAA